MIKLILSIVLIAMPCFAANHCVRQGGTGDGSTWAAALPDLPAILIRGDTYYMAGGSYGAHLFSDPGTVRISILSATPGVHGIATGWTDSMAGEAVFAASPATPNGAVWEFMESHYLIDGMVRNTDIKGGQWIHISNTNKVATRASVLIGDAMAHIFVGDVTLSHVNVEGSHAQNDADIHENGVELRCGSSATLFGSSVHDTGLATIFARGKHDGQTDSTRCNAFATAQLIVDQSYIARNYSSPEKHSEMCACSEGIAITFSNNLMEDPAGTAFFATPSGGGAATNNINNGPWYIYGNVLRMTTTRTLNGQKCGIGGVAQIFDTRFIAPFRIYNNIVTGVNSINCDSNTTPAIQIGLGFTTVMQEVTVENNIWFDSTVFTPPTQCPGAPVSCMSFTWQGNTLNQ